MRFGFWINNYERSFLPLGCGLILVIGSAYVHGVMTNRWAPPPDLSPAAAKLDKLPAVIGDWHSQPIEMSEGQIKAAEVVGYFCRVYRNDKTRAEIQITVLCGPHGPISVHSPTICFPGAGLQQAYPEKKETVDSGKVKGEFWRTTFTMQSPDGVREDVDTFWAWSTDGICEAPNNPRLQYASSPHLYKIYATQRRNAAEAHKTNDEPLPGCEEFLKDFLPAFRSAISGS